MLEEFENHFHKHTTGIITFVSIANITLHSILLTIAETIKQSQLFKHFIDDIIWLSIGKTTTQDIQKILNNVFESACLKLDFRHICTQLQIPGHLEFVNHVIDNNCNCDFFYKRLYQTYCFKPIFPTGLFTSRITHFQINSVFRSNLHETIKRDTNKLH